MGSDIMMAKHSLKRHNKLSSTTLEIGSQDIQCDVYVL